MGCVCLFGGEGGWQLSCCTFSLVWFPSSPLVSPWVVWWPWWSLWWLVAPPSWPLQAIWNRRNIISFCFNATVFLKLNLISIEFSIPLGHTGLTKCSSFQLSCVKTMKEKLLILNWKSLDRTLFPVNARVGQHCSEKWTHKQHVRRPGNRDSLARSPTGSGLGNLTRDSLAWQATISRVTSLYVKPMQRNLRMNAGNI